MVLEYLFVIWSGSKLRETYCRSFGQDAALADELVIVRLEFIVLLPHGGHAEGSLVDQVFEHYNILFKLFQF